MRCMPFAMSLSEISSAPTRKLIREERMTEFMDSNLNPLTPNEPTRESWYGMQSGAVLAGRYRIERLISRGGMGAVFEATQLGLDRAEIGRAHVELQSLRHLVCRLLLEKKKKNIA